MDFIIIAVVGMIVYLAGSYIKKEKQRGNTCIGCPDAKTCAACGSCRGCAPKTESGI